MNLNILLVFLAGLGSFLSPCVLPLIPSYISFLGASGNHSPIPSTLGFIGGFSVVFVMLGLIIAGVGGFVLQNPIFLSLGSLVAGLFLIILGLHLSFGLFPFLYREVRYHYPSGTNRASYRTNAQGIIRGVGVGAAFGAGWTPCIGPMLAAVLALAASSGNPAIGAFYLGVYSLGLGIPFLGAAVFIKRFKSISSNLKPYMAGIQKMSGFILLGFGILVSLGRFQSFTGWILGLGISLGDWSESYPFISRLTFTVFYAGLALSLMLISRFHRGLSLWGKLPSESGSPDSSKKNYKNAHRFFSLRNFLIGFFLVLGLLEAMGLLHSGNFAALWLQFEGF